jgi:hypothetical protein
MVDRDNIRVEKAVLMDRSGLAEGYVQCSRVWADRALRKVRLMVLAEMGLAVRLRATTRHRAC